MKAAPEERSRSPIPWAISAALLLIATLAARWPGVAMYDSVSQYGQALDGEYSDWHPPIMARVWALLNHVHAGTEPYFLIQMALWWGGFGLLSAALGRKARHGAAALVLLVGAMPLWLGWATVVLKDAQMACCLVAATGIVANWRLAERPTPRWAAAGAALLIGYATLVRGNAAFATAPFALALLDWVGVRRRAAQVGLVVAAIAAVLLVSPLLNRGLLGAEPSHVERSLPVYDLAGIAHFSGAVLPGITSAEWSEAERRGCYTPFFWNPYGEPAECGFVGDRLAFGGDAGGYLIRDWADQMARHPLVYARHRIGHFNANIRLWVGVGEHDAVPPVASEPNPLGLGAPPTEAGRMLIAAAGWLAETPFGWPASWLALAIGLAWAARGGGGQVALGWALALSAATMSASFLVVSIASDLRYHLWSMVAAALALVLLADAGAIARRRGRIVATGVVVVVLLGSVARFGLASPVPTPLPPRVPPPATLR